MAPKLRPSAVLHLQAKARTFVKAGVEKSRVMAPEDKLEVAPGALLTAKLVAVHEQHAQIEQARLDGSEAPPRLSYLFLPDWSVLDVSPPAEDIPHAAHLSVELPKITELAEHYLHFHHGSSVLVVTFDHLGARHQTLKPWAGKFVRGSGYSLLGITSKLSSWFRSPELHDVLENLAARGFFAQFDRVVFAGPSMGGFGAGVFSCLAPGSTVVMTSPQSTLDARLVPWEQRYAMGRSLAWNGRYTDAAAETGAAARVIIVYDPRVEPDRLHAERFPVHNRLLLPACHLGHTVLAAMQEMGVLKPFMLACIEGSITRDWFRGILRQRRLSGAYHRSLYLQAKALGRVRTADAIRALRPDVVDAVEPELD